MGPSSEQASAARSESPRARRPPPARLGWIFVGVYALAIAAALVHWATASGDMGSLFLMALLLPWIALSQSIYVFFGGLVLNFLLAFGLGYAISRFRGGG